jgi:putative PEP-CTERM system TPR-repeat lipoprotein
LLLEAGRYEEALKHFRDAIEISPGSPEFLFNAARAQLALNQKQAARDSLGKALSIRPDWVPAIVLMADIDAGDGRFEAALASADRLKKSPNTAAVGHSIEGQIRLKQKDYAAADRAFAEAYRLAPSSEMAIRSAGARRAGKLPNPDQPLLAWLERQPSDPRARFVLGESLQSRGDRAGAIREYEKGLEAAPNDAAALNNLAWLYLEAGDKRAEAVAKQAYASAPTAWPIADTYGWILVRAGKARDGLQILKQAAEKSGNNPEVMYHLGVAQAQSGQATEAKATLAKALAGAGSAPWKSEAEKAAAGLK